MIGNNMNGEQPEYNDMESSMTDSQTYVDSMSIDINGDVMYVDNSHRYYHYGILHREDGPALIYPDRQYWCNEGRLHREDGPAVIKDDNYEAWYRYGLKHRVGGPAVSYSNGDREWYQNDRLHREDGPAVINNEGGQKWYYKGKLHREDGPAVITHDGYKKWFYHGQPIYNEADYQSLTKLTHEEMLLMVLKFGAIK